MRKGKKSEDIAAEILEGWGYVIDKSQSSSRRINGKWMSLRNDFFNAFDIMATKDNEPVRWIQVTDVSHKSARQKKIDKVPLDPTHNSIEIWAWKGGRKRLDRRYKEKVYIQSQIFIVYKKTERGDWIKVMEVDKNGRKTHSNRNDC